MNILDVNQISIFPIHRIETFEASSLASSSEFMRTKKKKEPWLLDTTKVKRFLHQSTTYSNRQSGIRCEERLSVKHMRDIRATHLLNQHSIISNECRLSLCIGLLRGVCTP